MTFSSQHDWEKSQAEIKEKSWFSLPESVWDDDIGKSCWPKYHLRESKLFLGQTFSHPTYNNNNSLGIILKEREEKVWGWEGQELQPLY